MIEKYWKEILISKRHYIFIFFCACVPIQLVPEKNKTPPDHNDVVRFRKRFVKKKM